MGNTIVQMDSLLHTHVAFTVVRHQKDTLSSLGKPRSTLPGWEGRRYS